MNFWDWLIAGTLAWIVAKVLLLLILVWLIVGILQAIF